MYNATINQQPPNVDFSLKLHPEPSSMKDHHPLAKLRLETAWANQMTWFCARVTNFCFDKSTAMEPGLRMKNWQTLWDEVQSWKTDRPTSFDPIFIGQAEHSVFPEMYFTADWHSRSNSFPIIFKLMKSSRFFRAVSFFLHPLARVQAWTEIRAAYNRQQTHRHGRTL